VAAVRRRCRERLHPAMVPTVVMAADQLPRMASGKLDRRALAAALVAATRVEPQTVGGWRWRDTVEERVAGLYHELCGVAPSAPSDELLALGGHSLVAARIAARL